MGGKGGISRVLAEFMGGNAMERRRFAWWGKCILWSALILAILSGCSGLSLGAMGEPVTLKFSFFKNVADYEPLAAEFHRQHPNITIELHPAEYNNNGARLLTAEAGDMDAIRISSTMIPEELLTAFLSLDLQVSTAKNFPEEELFPGSLEGLKLNGKQIGLPAGINPFVVFYSPKKFAGMNVQLPPPNWALAEFVNTAVAANHPDGTQNDTQIGSDQFAYGFCSHPAFNDAALVTYLFGGGLFDSLTIISRPTLNERANIEALSWYASLKTDMGVIPVRNSAREVGMLVARSGCGLWIDWLDRSSFGGYGPNDATPLPLPAYNQSFNIATQDGYFILAKSEHPEEAWQWIRYLMEQQSASGSQIPPLKAQIDSEEYATRADKGTLAVARSLPPQMVVLGLEMSRNQRFGKVLELFAQAAEQVFDGKKDAQTALDEAQQQAENIFK
jgi:multiple sugar transport system substrate-binding protein